MSGPSTVVTAVRPVKLFGCELPGMYAINSGSRVVGLVKPKGRTVEVLDGDLKHLGLNGPKVRKMMGA